MSSRGQGINDLCPQVQLAQHHPINRPILSKSPLHIPANILSNPSSPIKNRTQPSPTPNAPPHPSRLVTKTFHPTPPSLQAPNHLPHPPPLQAPNHLPQLPPSTTSTTTATSRLTPPQPPQANPPPPPPAPSAHRTAHRSPPATQQPRHHNISYANTQPNAQVAAHGMIFGAVERSAARRRSPSRFVSLLLRQRIWPHAA